MFPPPMPSNASLPSSTLHSASRSSSVARNANVAVILSAEEYERLSALNRDEFERFCDRVAERAAARGMTEEKLAEMLADDG